MLGFETASHIIKFGKTITVFERRAGYRYQLAGLDDKELLDLYKEAEANFNVIEVRNIHRLPEKFYIGSAAADVLRARHGEKYFEELTR